MTIHRRIVQMSDHIVEKAQTFQDEDVVQIVPSAA